MNKKEKMLYIMHVDWGWIKQRPHFLAEGLSQYYNLLVMFRFNPNRKQMLSNDSRIKKIPLITIPRRFGILFEKMDDFVQKIWIRIIIFFFRPQKIWLTFPTQFKYLPKKAVDNMEIYYDCMDDSVEFYSQSKQKQRIKQLEKIVVEKSKVVFCSSKHLCNVLINRHNTVDNLVLVRNGLKESFLKSNKVDISLQHSFLFEKNEDFKDVVYIGTVAEWINFKLIDQCLDKYSNLRFHFIGPVDVKPTFNNSDRVKFYGAIEHDQLLDNAPLYDVLIMPFVRNELIESVDPVKLYEYISFNKPIISVFYTEIDRFGEFVYFYNDEEDFMKIMNEVSAGKLENKYYENQGDIFLQSNTWNKRVDTVLDALYKSVK